MGQLSALGIAFVAFLCTGCAASSWNSSLLGPSKAVAGPPVELPATREVVITTAILEPDPQAGMKSTHRIIVDFERRSVTDQFETGTTDFFGISLASVRNRFLVENVSYSGDVVRFRARGETASGVRILPNINYRFDVWLTRDGSQGSVTGCHDGYPSYEVRFGRILIYWFKHRPRQLLNLFGTCDETVD